MGGVDASLGTLIVEGKPVIQGNTNLNGDNCNVYLGRDVIRVDSPVDGMRIGVYKVDQYGQPCSGAFAIWEYVKDKDPAQFFTSDVDSFAVRKGLNSENIRQPSWWIATPSKSIPTSPAAALSPSRRVTRPIPAIC